MLTPEMDMPINCMRCPEVLWAQVNATIAHEAVAACVERAEVHTTVLSGSFVEIHQQMAEFADSVVDTTIIVMSRIARNNLCPGPDGTENYTCPISDRAQKIAQNQGL